MATNDIGRVTPIWRGFYSAAATYELNDIVIDTSGSVWWHKSPEVTTGVTPAASAIWDAVIDMSVFSGLIQAAITTAQTALAAAQAALADVAADMERAETAADNAENSAAAASESAAGVGALAQAAAASAEAAAGSATGAAGSAQAAAGSKSDAEAYAVGKRGGEDVGSTDPTYHNNAKYYAEQAASEAEAAAQSAEDAQDVLDSIPEDYSQLSADVGDLKTQMEDIVKSYDSILPYLYKKDVYINTRGVETTLNGFDLYYVPIEKYGHIDMVWDATNKFYQGLNAAYVFHILNSDNTISNVAANSPQAEYEFAEGQGCATIINRTGYKGVYISVLRGNENGFSIFDINQTNAILNEYKESFPIKIDKNGKFSSNRIYFRNTNALVVDFGNNINGVKFHVYPGDKLRFENSVSGLTYRGNLFYDNDQFVITMDVVEYTVENEGIFCAIVLDSNPEVTTLYIPKNRTKILYEDVLNTPNENDAYKGKKGVAFGTSLTYRGQEGQTGGYLNFLPELTGMTWDNQGLGSATILEYGSLPKMLPKITDYTDYSDKDICILEGFVNDWYYNGNTLGTWKDTGTTTVCGCVRYALNYIFSQNANITAFLVLDHIGKNVSVDCSSLAENAGNKTQSEYYDEIAKVAESMGVHVIKEYAESEISENTPQYLRDNIHLTMLGAKQSANTIWECMKKYVPNVVTV